MEEEEGGGERERPGTVYGYCRVSSGL
jgi:hypothetical protein